MSMHFADNLAKGFDITDAFQKDKEASKFYEGLANAEEIKRKRKGFEVLNIDEFMSRKFSNPDMRAEFYERLMSNQIPYKEYNEIVKAMLKEEDEKKENFKQRKSIYGTTLSNLKDKARRNRGD